MPIGFAADPLADLYQANPAGQQQLLDNVLASGDLNQVKAAIELVLNYRLEMPLQYLQQLIRVALRSRQLDEWFNKSLASVIYVDDPSTDPVSLLFLTAALQASISPGYPLVFYDGHEESLLLACYKNRFVTGFNLLLTYGAIVDRELLDQFNQFTQPFDVMREEAIGRLRGFTDQSLKRSRYTAD